MISRARRYQCMASSGLRRSSSRTPWISRYCSAGIPDASICGYDGASCRARARRIFSFSRSDCVSSAARFDLAEQPDREAHQLRLLVDQQPRAIAARDRRR